MGYQRSTSVALLGDRGHIETFHRFPNRFTYTDAKRIFGKSDGSTANLLNKCLSLGLLRQEDKCYVKAAL